MSIILFAGPSLSPADVLQHLAAEICPPAMRGDILRYARKRPLAIGLIDGYFDGVPSVWHKEILWAMSQGVHVYGAASMGALRAAELAPYGMTGVGQIFQSYLTGELVADDEVAVAHGTEEEHFRALSDALVNMRATLRKAARDNVISFDSADKLIAHERQMHFAERTYGELICYARKSSLPSTEVDALQSWLPTGRIDQKRLDALVLVEKLADCSRNGWKPKTVTYSFSHTDGWEALWRATTPLPGDASHTRDLAINSRLDALAVTGGADSARMGGVARALAIELARQRSVQVNATSVRATADEFRRERGLVTAEQFALWRELNTLQDADVDQFFVEEATVRRVHAEFESELVQHVVNHLRTTGEYAKLAGKLTPARESLVPKTHDADADGGELAFEDSLWQWYFLDHLRVDSVPTDLDTYAARCFTTLPRLRRVVLEEYRRRDITHNRQ